MPLFDKPVAIPFDYKFLFLRMMQSISFQLPITVGHWAMVAAGSVAIRDVQDFELIAGNPAKHIGWVGKSGKRLNEIEENVWACSLTGEIYFLDSNGKLTLREKHD
jgi:hypothetical protein